MDLARLNAVELSVEDVPPPEFAVTAKIDESGTDAARRHADLHQGVALIFLGVATRGQRLHPVGRQVFLGWDDRGPGLGGKLLEFDGSPGARRRCGQGQDIAGHRRYGLEIGRPDTLLVHLENLTVVGDETVDLVLDVAQ